jgi:lysophospholipase L1-like esterase
VKDKTIAAAWVILIAMISLALAPARGSSSDQAAGHWVGTWATSPFLAGGAGPNAVPGFKDTTLRQIVHVSIGGRAIRVRFTNEFGGSPLVISSAHVALSARGGAIRPETDKALLFSGQASVTIPGGAPTYSDPLDFTVAPLSDLVITIHLVTVPDGITSHSGSSETSYLQAGDAVSAADLSAATHVDHWYFLDGVDVESKSAGGAVLTFGDSITDGAFSTKNTNARWPDDLARRLAAGKKTAGIGVLNEGIGGNRLIHDMTGPNALARFDRDVLEQSGVRWIIVLEGINDIGNRVNAAARHEVIPTPQDLIAAYQQIILRAHAHHIRVYGCTILPFEGAHYYTPEGEVDRQAVNRWIRTSGAFDAVIDLDAATRDATDPAHLKAGADSGDHLHPGDAGYKVMADAIDLKLFSK